MTSPTAISAVKDVVVTAVLDSVDSVATDTVVVMDLAVGLAAVLLVVTEVATEAVMEVATEEVMADGEVTEVGVMVDTTTDSVGVSITEDAVVHITITPLMYLLILHLYTLVQTHHQFM